MSVAAVILAAGFSRRLGRPKQTVVLGGETLVEHAARTAQEAGLDPIIVVVNPEGEFGHSLWQRGCVVVVNEHAAEGMASSIRCGIQSAMLLKASGAVLMTCDQVAVSPKHLRQLIDQAPQRTGSGYAGRAGIPAYFSASDFDALLLLQGDTGARDLLLDARVVPFPDLAFDIDSEEDIARAERRFNTSGEVKKSIPLCG